MRHSTFFSWGSHHPHIIWASQPVNNDHMASTSKRTFYRVTMRYGLSWVEVLGELLQTSMMRTCRTLLGAIRSQYVQMLKYGSQCYGHRVQRKASFFACAMGNEGSLSLCSHLARRCLDTSSCAQNANAPAQSNCVCVTTAMQQCRPKIAKIGEQFSGLGQRAAIKPSWKSVHDCQHAHFQSPMHEEKSPTAMTVSEQAACFRSFCVNSILLRVSRTRELVHCTANLAATFYK